MVEAPELRSVVAAAEQAAAAGDYASAEQFLRQAALLQEKLLGPVHPDLANTLNNLGIVCERAGKPADAEQCYRRAHKIATASLAPGHPFVATSRKNLEVFCDARRIPVDSPVPATPPSRPPQAAPRPRATPPTPAVAPVAVTAEWSSRTLIIAALVVGGLALVIFIAVRPWVSTSGRPASSASSVPPTPQQTTAPPEPAAVPAPALRPTAGPKGPALRPAPVTRGASPSVVSAQLCRNPPAGGPSGAWRCDPGSGPLDPGTLFFYTRVASTSDTIVQHRWYRGDRLHQTIELRVRANQRGYRTYSRNTVSPDRAGDWRVELRSQDGRVLHEERFSVR